MALLTVEDPHRQIRAAVYLERLIAAVLVEQYGESPEDGWSPQQLKAAANESGRQIKLHMDVWHEAAEKQSVTSPSWLVYIHYGKVEDQEQKNKPPEDPDIADDCERERT